MWERQHQVAADKLYSMCSNLVVFFSRRVLFMEFINGTPIMNLGEEMDERGINPGGKVAAMAKQEFGIGTSDCADGSKELLQLARGMFDTKLPPHVKTMTPFSDDSFLKKLSIKSFPEELFFVLRTVNLLRGLRVGLGINYSCAEQWKPIAEEALSAVGSQPDKQRRRGIFKRLFWRR